MGWLTAIWAGWGRLSGETKWIIFCIVAGALIVLWLRHDAAEDVRRELENDSLKGRIENIEDAKGKRDEIQNLDSDDFDAAIDGLPRSDPAD